MKRFLIFFSVVCFALAAIAKNWEKEYKKIIENCDAPIESRMSNNPTSFWYYTIWNNQTYAEFAQALTKKKGSAVKAIQNLNQAKGIASNHYSNLTIENSEAAQNLAAQLKNDLGAISVSDDVQIYFIVSDQINAFVHPDGTMYVYTGLVTLPEVKYEHILGVCAHEMTHYSLQHAATHCYAAQKKLDKNNLIAGIASCVVAAGGIYAATQGVDVSDSVDLFTQAAFDIAFVDARNYYFKYSRDQEYEADLHAYRFLEAAGYNGDSYIEMLKIMKKYEGGANVNEKDSDHPLTEHRIGLLSYAKAHPEIQHKKPKKTFDDVNFN